MQNGCAPVEGNDIPVRQFLLAMSGGVAVGLMHLEFRCTVHERIPGGQVPARPAFAGPSHAFLFVIRLHGAAVVKMVDEILRVDRCETPGFEFILPLAEEGNPASTEAQQGFSIGCFPGHLDFDTASPAGLRQCRRQVPVVRGLMEAQQRPFAWQVSQKAFRHVRQRNPLLKQWVGFEKTRIVVQKVVPFASRISYQAIETTGLQRGFAAGRDCRDMAGEKVIDILAHGVCLCSDLLFRILPKKIACRQLETVPAPLRGGSVPTIAAMQQAGVPTTVGGPLGAEPDTRFYRIFGVLQMNAKIALAVAIAALAITGCAKKENSSMEAAKQAAHEAAEAAGEAASAAGEAASAAGEAVVDTGKAAAEATGDAVEGAVEATKDAGEAVADAAGEAADAAEEMADEAVAKTGEVVEAAGEKVEDAGEAMQEKAAD